MKALDILEETTKRVGNKWETGLLWKDRNIKFPESKTAALKRLYSVERKADKDAAFAELYVSKFEDYIGKGYLQEASTQSEQVNQWYLPHFFAYHPNKKPRLVFDAASKSNGYSFNDFFLTGPDLLQSLVKVLLRFRIWKIGLIGDIREMFHQVKLRDQDQLAQTLLYRGMKRDAEPKLYQMTVLFFGSVCSPVSAIYVKDKNASSYQEQYPNSVRAIISDTYVGDFLSGADTVDDAFRLWKEVVEIHGAGGFPIEKWSSSSHKVLKSIPEEMKAQGSRQLGNKSDIGIEKTLGLQWDPTSDCFSFKVQLSKIPVEVLNGKRRPTKRELASFIMSLIDPLGFITPLKITGLMIFQATWKMKIGWDDEITSSLEENWNKYLTLLNQITSVSIPRCIRTAADKSSQYELHTFCDASEEAYVCVCYLRVITRGKITVSFLAGKGRVAPIKGLSVPRMELNAALIGTRLATAIKKFLLGDIKISQNYFWTDSKTVLCWIRSETGRFSQYVANRTNEIISASNVCDWKWVPTGANAADDATRSFNQIELTSDCRWLKGSSFLFEHETEWPKEAIRIDEIDETDLEMKKVVMVVAAKMKQLPLPNAEDFSCWFTLIKKTAARIAAFRIFGNKGSTEITQQDMEKAKCLWNRQVQMDSFPDEIAALANGGTVDKRSPLFGISPVISSDGLIKLQGRINRAPNVSESVKNPVILDPKHRYSKLLIRWIHVKHAHQGQETIINELRKEYWIIACRTAVRSAIANCLECKLQRAKPIPQLMGELPEARVSSSQPPFTYSATDLFGPIEVTIGRRREKRWGILFTCLSSRAVYIDLVPSLSSSDFIDALVRFNSRRGPARELWSDNATNFRGAAREIKECIESWDKGKIQDALLKRGTKFNFIAPASPHMGGCHERMIGVAKKILMKLLKSRAPKEYILLTILAEVENIMNSRPLSVTSPDPKDPECLTPNHLLKIKCVPGQFVPGDFSNSEHTRRMWRTAQKVAEEFWNRWRQECLPNLIKREKWNVNQQPIREGDLVILLDDQAERNCWKKGIVIKTYPGRDGHVRVVDVRIAYTDSEGKVKFSELRRHVIKICITGLNVNDKTSSYGREKMS